MNFVDIFEGIPKRILDSILEEILGQINGKFPEEIHVKVWEPLNYIIII